MTGVDRVLKAMRDIQSEGRIPSVRTICDYTGFTSTSTVHGHIKNLERLRLVSRVKFGREGYVVAESCCPTCGRAYSDDSQLDR